MKDSTGKWLAFAEENLGCARVVKDSGYHNASLQNSQQSVEKALKALVIENELEFLKTHSIQQLRDILASAGLGVDLTDEQCELLDSIYLPSKYPLGSALPASDPDLEICDKCVRVAEAVLRDVRRMLSSPAEYSCEENGARKPDEENRENAGNEA